jgi:hypothetical protein
MVLHQPFRSSSEWMDSKDEEMLAEEKYQKTELH